MGRLNKSMIQESELLQLEGQLFNALARTEVGEIEAYLRGLLSAAELEMIAKRVGLVRMLADGKIQAEIANRLKLSPTTISHMSSRLRYDRSLQKLAHSLKESS
jgi:uncharacterized protein YerC